MLVMKNLYIMILFCVLCLWAEPPLVWKQPADFNPKAAGLGLSPLEGVEIQDLYKPLVSHADPSEGGNGHYESVLHGTYNHHPQIAVIDDQVIVYWTNHVRDENGPGQRMLAKIGRFTADGGVDWGSPNDIVEIAPPATAATLRPNDDRGDVVSGLSLNGSFLLIDGRLFLRGLLFFCDGWTDTPLYHSQNTKPVPDEHYRSGRDRQYRFDIYWRVVTFVQEWKLEDGRLQEASPMYFQGTPMTECQITPTIRKRMPSLNAPYATARPFAEASEDFRNTLKGNPVEFVRVPKYAPNTMKNAADGLNGLAHYTEFIRPDGKYVVVRDNLLATQTYYSAVKEHKDDFYPPAEKTNLFGTAMPVAGELPDGTVWLVGSDASRQNAFITWSRDGVTFDKTKLLLHVSYEAIPGLCKGKCGGTQYFKVFSKGDNIWLVCSVAKEKVSLIRIPIQGLK